MKECEPADGRVPSLDATDTVQSNVAGNASLPMNSSPTKTACERNIS